MNDIVGVLKGEVGWGCSATSEERLDCPKGNCKCDRQIKKIAADEIERMRDALRFIEIETHSSQEFHPHSMQIIRNIIQSVMGNKSE